MSALKNCGVAK